MNPSASPTPERWAAIEAGFAEALALPPAEREAFLGRLTGADPELADEVRSLLGSRDSWWLDEAVVALPRDVAPVEASGERIGPYQLVRSLGLGGMGEVWLAVREGEGFRQSVALKIVKSGMESAELLAGFRAERQILGTLNHPNIAHLLDVGETAEGLPYLALEYVEGVPLTEYCARERLPLRERLRLFRSVCDAVRYAHQNLVVHRDLKPSNILVTEQGVPKLLDFGIAKVLSPNTDSAGLPIATPDSVLTPDYAAPEQVEGGTITTASDLYSLGVVLYELVAGARPYRAGGRGQTELAKVIREYVAVPPSRVAKLHGPLAEDLDAIVLKAMAKDPAARYSSAEQLGLDVERALASRPVSARPRTAGYVARRFVRRHQLGVALAGVALLVLVGFLVTVLRQSAAIRERSVQVEQQRQRAQEVATFLQQLFRGADPAEARGATITARELLDRGAARVSRELTAQPAVQADLMGVMSGIYQDLGLYEPAERLAASALAVRQRSGAPGGDSALAVSLVEHGKALHWKGDAQQAEARYREALAVWRRLGDTTGPQMALTLTYLGSALQDEGQDSAATALYRDALALERRWSVPADTILALTLNNLGVMLRRQRDLAGAEAAHREALALRRRALGEDHPDALQSLNNVAVAVGSRGDLSSAEPLFVEVVDRWRRVLGDRHPRVADALTNLAGLYLRRKEPLRALPLYTEALAIRTERFGAKSAPAAQSLFNLGVALQDAGRKAEARQRYRDALAVRVAVFGPDHPSVKAAREALTALEKR